MAFLVGCILIYHYDLDWWWYPVALAWYVAEWVKHYEYYQKISAEIADLRADLERANAIDSDD